MKTFVALRLNMYSYFTDKGFVDKNAKFTKKCVQRMNRVAELLNVFGEKQNNIKIQIKGSGVRHTIYFLRKSTRLHLVQIMIREYKQLVESCPIHTV